MALRELLNRNRESILAAASRHGAHRVRVIGSVARGDDDERSDIDLLVEFEPERSLLDHAALIDDLQEMLGRKVDVASDRGLRPQVREKVLADAVPL